MLFASPSLPKKDCKNKGKVLLTTNQERDEEPVKEGKQEKDSESEEEIVPQKAQHKNERVSQAQGEREEFDLDMPGLEVYTGATLLSKGSGFQPKDFYQAVAHALPRDSLEQWQKEMQETLEALNKYFKLVDSLRRIIILLIYLLTLLVLCGAAVLFASDNANLETGEMNTIAKIWLGIYVGSCSLLGVSYWLIPYFLNRVGNNISERLDNANIKYKKLMVRLFSCEMKLEEQGLHSDANLVQQYKKLCRTPINSEDAYWHLSQLEKEIQSLLAPVIKETPWYAFFWKKPNNAHISPSTLEAGRLRFVS